MKEKEQYSQKINEDKLETVSFKIEKQLMNKVRAVANYGGVSNFIRKSLHNQLMNKFDETQEFKKVIKSLEINNYANLNQALMMIEFKSQTIVDILSKQNEEKQNIDLSSTGAMLDAVNKNIYKFQKTIDELRFNLATVVDENSKIKSESQDKNIKIIRWGVCVNLGIFFLGISISTGLIYHKINGFHKLEESQYHKGIFVNSSCALKKQFSTFIRASKEEQNNCDITW